MIVKHPDILTLFVTSACADWRLNKLISIIFKLRFLSFSMEGIGEISFQEKYKVLNKYAVLVEKHCQYRVEMIF